MPVRVPKHVVVHPIVLLSVVDHFNRLSRIGNQRRVVGILLGSWRSGVVDVATSFAGEECSKTHTSHHVEDSGIKNFILELVFNERRNDCILI